MDYLGALPISASRSTNLAALQRPLKDLYFKWRALRNLGHSNLPGTLEINDTGLTVQYIRELHKGVQVKFVKKKFKNVILTEFSLIFFMVFLVIFSTFGENITDQRKLHSNNLGLSKQQTKKHPK